MPKVAEGWLRPPHNNAAHYYRASHKGGWEALCGQPRGRSFKDPGRNRLLPEPRGPACEQCERLASVVTIGQLRERALWPR